MSLFVSFISGAIFSVGLVISGMINPNKVIGFLNIFEQWDYSLALVMGGAVAFNLIAFKLIKRIQTPLLGEKFHWPTKNDIDRKLIFGAGLFGIGWGIIGICPGPGVVNLLLFDHKVIAFILSMLFAMASYKFIAKKLE